MEIPAFINIVRYIYNIFFSRDEISTPLLVINSGSMDTVLEGTLFSLLVGMAGVPWAPSSADGLMVSVEVRGSLCGSV